MQISVKHIQAEQGSSLHAEFVEDMTQAVWGGVLRPLAPVRVDVSITNSGECLVVRGRIQAQVELLCSLCLATFPYQVDVPFAAEFFQAQRRQPVRDGGSEDMDDDVVSEADERDYYTGDMLDITDAVRENVILAVPMKALCRDGCLGICPRCGADRNQATCDCSPEAPDPRLSPLRDFFNQN